MEMPVLSHDQGNPAGNDATSSRQDDLRVQNDSPCLVQQDSRVHTGVLRTFRTGDLKEILRRRFFLTDQPVVDANYCPPTVYMESSARLRFDGNALNGNSSTAISCPPFQSPAWALGDQFNSPLEPSFTADISGNDNRSTAVWDSAASTTTPWRRDREREGKPLYIVPADAAERETEPGDGEVAYQQFLTEIVLSGILISNPDPELMNYTSLKTNFAMAEEVSPSLPSADPVPRKDCFLVAGAKGFVCAINVGEASSELFVYNRSTDQFNVLMLPLDMHPKTMCLRADDNGNYKVLVSGRTNMTDTGDSSLINCTMVYSSTTSAWEPCEGNSPSFRGIEFQNGRYDEDRGLLLCVAAADEEGSRVVVAYDFKKVQWQDSIKYPVVAVTGSSISSSIIPRLITAHLIGCGESIFLFRVQDISGSGRQFLFHKLHPDTLEEKEVRRPYKGVGGAGSRGLEPYPEFHCIPGTATFIEFDGSVFVFSEQERSDKRFICIHHLHGDSWMEISRSKRTRHRGPPWKIDEIDAFFRWLEQALKISITKPPWKFIADGLKGEGYNRSEKSCEDLLGTLRRESRYFQDFIPNNPTIEVWNMTKDERSRHKLPRRFTESWYFKLEELIPVKKGSGQKRSQIVNAVRDPVTLVSSLATSEALPASSAQTPLVLGVKDSIDVEQVEVDRLPGMAAITSEVDRLHDVGGRREWTYAERLEIKKIDLKMKEIDLESKKLDIQKLQLMEKNKAHEDCEEPPTKKPRKRVCRK